MGKVKDLMMEMEQEPEFRDIEVSFICPTCGHPAAAYAQFPTDDEGIVEEIACFNRDTPHKSLVSLRDTKSGIKGRLNDHPGERVSVRQEITTDDDWEDPPPEPGSYGIFLGALEEWRANVTELATAEGDSSRNRMLFSTLYSIVEAYLSDTITSTALEDPVIMGRMLKLDGLKDKTVSLETVFAKPSIVKDMVKTTLQGLSFHNLGSVHAICRIAFDRPFLPTDDEGRAMLMKSVDKRHDCVHRNGHDKDGNKHTDITKLYLIKLGILLEQLARGLEDSIQDAKIQRFFEDIGTAEVK